MRDFRNRPKDNYINEADWQKLYVLTEDWKSNLLFYNDDLKFLLHLIDKYFMWISRKENIDMVREIEVGLLKLDNECSSLLNLTNKHLHHLGELIDNPFVYDSHKFRTEHEQLEDKIANFVKDCRKNRKEVFTITEYLIDGEEMVRKLNLVSR
ncbi:hypothetical protein [Kriegella aquimaris]|uniref:Uncharacterized protein n=1 Tax=Kriegella aquimaris TaxID=192904 RepID=A0A1G9JH63_9FLAO|nr:hypothetical protein [Kriegella aquimaris]SDL36464.1 hypothetical protein SAMN04488514_101540 [Kriegella aquimaris]